MGPGAQAGTVGCEVLGAGGVGGGDDGEDAAGLGGKLDVAGVGEVDAVVAGGGDEDGPGLIGGVCDAVEGGLESGTLAGVEIDESAEGEIDDVGVLGDGVLDSLNDPGLRRPLACPVVHWVAMSGAVLEGSGRRSRTLMLRRVAAGATPMRRPVPGPMAAAASEATHVPWPC